MRKFLLIICLISLFQLFSQTKGIVIKKQVQNETNSKRWAIVIGINDFEDNYIADLQKARNDAKVLSDVLKNEGQFDFVFTFTDDNDKKDPNYPSYNNITAKMEYLKNEIKPEDTLLFCFSGHGISDEDGNQYLVLADTVISHPYKTSLSMNEVNKWIKDLGVKKDIVMLDACRNVIEKTKSVNNDKNLMKDINKDVEISAVFYATSQGEFSYEHDKEPYGFFTTYSVRGMKGDADANGDGLISFMELKNYVENGVKNWALDRNKKQKPFTKMKEEFTGDLIISAVPATERKPFNPNTAINDYTRRMNLYKGLNYSSIGIMSAGFVSAAIGGLLLGVGYYQYSNLKVNSSASDWNTYKYLTSAGFITTIVGGSIGIVATIPLGVSFGIKTKKSNN